MVHSHPLPAELAHRLHNDNTGQYNICDNLHVSETWLIPIHCRQSEHTYDDNTGHDNLCDKLHVSERWLIPIHCLKNGYTDDIMATQDSTIYVTINMAIVVIEQRISSSSL